MPTSILSLEGTVASRLTAQNITKHRNDVFRLYRTLAPDARFVLPAQLRDDLSTFLESLPPDSQDWKNIRAAVKGLPEPRHVIAQIRENFGIGERGLAFLALCNGSTGHQIKGVLGNSQEDVGL